ncbi:glycerate kinase [Thalassobacillus devorans]|uniref:Glycerate kinase n=1 Tax=Thalassobacillus devorans TaxID=279813 RepID=A0ABQ1NU61_9BACI|nr:glycerate kinase [Thalassobacillus devorans]NIK28567.1 glycerate kinase [Thalassobacillus devorans]GGC85216.1 glycerate kinase [Thalassobacillus devorans]
MKIIVAPDSFKGSLSALEVSRSINAGIKRIFPQAEVLQLPVADGGEGTMDTLLAATGGEKRKVTVVGPLGNEVEAAYGILGEGETCVIEMASASGLALIPEGKLSPLETTTYGTGQLIKKAMDDGLSSFILALGGSATNDGGAGMLQALGLKILDNHANQIEYGGGELNKVSKIEMESFDKRIKDCKFLIASDVQNPFIGPDGASHIFGPQKGATPDIVKMLDENMAHWANEIEKVTDIHLHDLSGAGAAGGIGGAFQAFFPSEMKRGIDIVLEHTGLIDSLKGTDLVITGEGQVDLQTASGKTPMGVAQAAKRENVPTIILAGSVGEGVEILHQFGVVSVNSIINKPMTLNEAIENVKDLLTSSAEQVVRSFFHHSVNTEGGLYIEN